MAQQFALDLHYRKARTRAEFIEGPSHAEALAWLDRWPNWPAPALVLVGPASSGKSHLGEIWKEQSSAQILSATELTPAQVLAYTAEENVPAIIDHAELMVADRARQEAVFHLYNEAREEGAHLLLLARTPPSTWAFALPDLASRLKAAPLVQIAPPDDELISILLAKQFAERGLKVGGDVIDYLAARLERSYDALNTAVTTLDQHALDAGKTVTLALARNYLSHSGG